MHADIGDEVEDAGGISVIESIERGEHTCIFVPLGRFALSENVLLSVRPVREIRARHSAHSVLPVRRF